MFWREWAREVEIEPSLYAADFADLGRQIRELLEAGARTFHFDMGDGRFIDPVTIGPIVIASIAPIIHAGGGIIDCHLMVERPEKHFDQVSAAGGDSVTFHVEATADPAGAVALARSLGLGVGVAFNPATSVGQALDAAPAVDLVLCMSIHPGYSGQPFMEEAFARIDALRSGLPPDVRVQVDGGVKSANVAEIRRAGADLLVVGSGIFAASSPGAAYREIRGAASARSGVRL